MWRPRRPIDATTRVQPQKIGDVDRAGSPPREVSGAVLRKSSGKAQRVRGCARTAATPPQLMTLRLCEQHLYPRKMHVVNDLGGSTLSIAEPHKLIDFRDARHAALEGLWEKAGHAVQNVHAVHAAVSLVRDDCRDTRNVPELQAAVGVTCRSSAGRPLCSPFRAHSRSPRQPRGCGAAAIARGRAAPRTPRRGRGPGAP